MRAIQSVLADAAGVMKCEARFHPDITFGHFDLYAEPVETGEAFPLLRPEEAIAFFMRKVHRITALLPDVFLQVMEVSFEQFEESEADALSAALEKVGDIGVPSNASDLVLQFAAPPIALGIVDGVQLIRKVKWQQYQNTYIPPNNGPLSPFQSRQWALCVGN